MVIKQKNRFSRILFLAGIMIAGSGFLLSGCALLRSPNAINPAVTGPQIAVNPDSIRLGVATLMGTDIVFEGAGFRPGDSVFISLAEPDNTESGITSRIVNPDGTFTFINAAGHDNTGIIVADSKVNPDGTFTATITRITKVTELLRANLAISTYSEDGQYAQPLVITQEPIPPGVYTARATGMLSNQKAETKITISKPSITDRLKDWIGKKLGKIQDKRT